ncbi:MAG: NADP-dependent oxidoreductase [Pseudomonadota bacterium]
MTTETTQVVLLKRPAAQATPDCFELKVTPLADLEPGELRIAVKYISVDAGTRTMLRGEGFHHQVGLGEIVLAGGVGEVLESRAEGFAPGDAVRGPLGAQTVATLPAAQVEKIDASQTPISAYLGVLGGSTGVTAWIGMRRVAQPKPGDVFVVSAAAGAVGSIAGQIAKKEGATVIGIAGGPRKVAYLSEHLGFDAAIDYKNESVTDRLRELAPQGVNVLFDNVGGPVLDAVLDNIAMHARVIICGAISQYDHMDQIVGPSMYLRLAERQSRMEGFAYFHFPESIGPAIEELSQWLAAGSIVFDEEVLEGIERYPEALQFMFEGGNIGKLLVKPG